MRLVKGIAKGILESLANLKEMTGMEIPARSVPWLGPNRELTPRSMPGMVDLQRAEVISGIDYSASPDMLRFGGPGIHHYIWHGPCDGAGLRDLVIRNACKWASRSYRMRSGNSIERCAFFNTYPEHDVYWNLAGYNIMPGAPLLEPSFLMRNCYSEGAGSQNVQLVQIGENRAYEQGFPAQESGDWTEGGPIVVTDSLFRNSGRGIADGNARSAFALSFFESMNDVHVERVFVDKSMQEESSGCLLIERRKKAVIKNTILLMGHATQPLVKAVGVDHIVFQNCVFQARSGQNWLDFFQCPRVEFSGCSGSAKVQRDRQMQGPVQGFFGWAA